MRAPDSLTAEGFALTIGPQEKTTFIRIKKEGHKCGNWYWCLIEQLSEEKYECMVCCDVIRVMAPVWSCQSCFHVFHLNCIKKWARSPASQADGTSVTHGVVVGRLVESLL
ncbi:hypothetical protein GOODEAATRI_000946 [Goodea atripinnis]|uniref:RING-type domain-containing protein n=1 Tax=Goodea atripinnis TaxID=208336 RepID=A0ABV0N875_9TELE